MMARVVRRVRVIAEDLGVVGGLEVHNAVAPDASHLREGKEVVFSVVGRLDGGAGEDVTLERTDDSNVLRLEGRGATEVGAALGE
jgi:hypothetical protein